VGPVGLGEEQEEWAVNTEMTFGPCFVARPLESETLTRVLSGLARTERIENKQEVVTFAGGGAAHAGNLIMEQIKT